MNTKTALSQELPKIANEDWPVLNDLSKDKGRFQIKNKNNATDIEALSKNIESVSSKDDKIIQKNIINDEKLMSKTTAQVRKQPKQVANRSKVVKKEVQTISQPIQHKVVDTKPVMEQKLTQLENKEEVIASQATPVHPQTTQSITSPLTSRGLGNNVKTEESKLNIKSLLTFVAVGFMHLYVRKTTKVLKPLEFVAENFSKVFVAFLCLTVPILMTWALTTKIGFIATQMSSMNILTSVFSYIVFYIACVFIWVSAQVIASGVWAMLKTTLDDVAKVGKENR